MKTTTLEEAEATLAHWVDLRATVAVTLALADGTTMSGDGLLRRDADGKFHVYGDINFNFRQFDASDHIAVTHSDEGGRTPFAVVRAHYKLTFETFAGAE